MNEKKAVLISCFDWYETRLKPVKEYLQDNNYEVTVLLSDFNHLTKKKIQNFSKECTYIHVIRYARNISVSRLLSHIFFAKEIKRNIKKFKPNLIYVLIPPNSVSKVCARYKRHDKSTKLIFDIIDMWPESMPCKTYHNTFPFKYWKWLRDSSLEIADHIFTECSLYQDSFNKSIKNKSTTLYLFKNSVSSLDDITKIALKNVSDDTIRLCYLGSINHIIDIDSICKIIKALLLNHKVEIRIIGDGENKDRFLEELKKTGAHVVYYGPIFDEKEKREILSECNFAFNLMVESVNVGLTIKSIDYFSFGIPIINNIKGDTWSLVENYKMGLNFNGDVKDFVNVFNNTEPISRDWVHNQYQHFFSKEAFRENLKKGLKNV